jgi:phytoene synthase
MKFKIPIEYFEAFLHSMKMDLTVTEYQTYEDLYEYVYGSAAVIGLQMVHILGTVSPSDLNEAKIAAEKLGVAFQLANFIRDVGEDLDRGRVYLPVSELQVHGVTRTMLEDKVLTPQIRSALKEQIRRVRKLQAESDSGIKLLSPGSRECILAASELYCGIVDEVEKIDYEVFTKRAKTSSWRRKNNYLFCIPFLPQNIHIFITHRIRANPKSRSSTGADAIRAPIIASGLYITMFLEVSHQLVIS